MEAAERTPSAKPTRKSRLRAITVSSENRSALSNRTTIIAGVDGRSEQGRRFRDLTVAYSEPLGGFERLSEDEAALVRQAVTLTMQSEALQAAVARGEIVDAEQLVRLSNVLTRILATLKSRHKPKHDAGAPTLAEIAARHQKAAAE